MYFRDKNKFIPFRTSPSLKYYLGPNDLLTEMPKQLCDDVDHSEGPRSDPAQPHHAAHS